MMNSSTTASAAVDGSAAPPQHDQQGLDRSHGLASSSIISGDKGLEDSSGTVASDDAHLKQLSTLKQLSYCLKLLSHAHSDEEKFVALVMLPRLLDPEDRQSVLLAFSRMNFGFLTRLMRTRRTCSNQRLSQVKEEQNASSAGKRFLMDLLTVVKALTFFCCGCWNAWVVLR
jgi:hypothetical protein